MQPNTLTRREFKGKICVEIVETIHVGSETGSGSGAPPDPNYLKSLIRILKKFNPDPQHLMLIIARLHTGYRQKIVLNIPVHFVRSFSVYGSSSYLQFLRLTLRSTITNTASIPPKAPPPHPPAYIS